MSSSFLYDHYESIQMDGDTHEVKWVSVGKTWNG